MRLYAGLGAAALLFSALAQAGEVRYTGSALRDPFGGGAEAANKPDGFPAVENRLQALAIQGIVTSPGNPRAIISGKIYRVGGEPMPGIKITRIEKDGVYVLTEQKEVLLNLNRRTQTTKGKRADDLSKK